MAWPGRNHQEMEEHVSSAIPNYCNEKWRYCGGGLGALDVRTSSEGPRQHRRAQTQQSKGLRERVALVDDGQGSFI